MYKVGGGENDTKTTNEIYAGVGKQEDNPDYYIGTVLL